MIVSPLLIEFLYGKSYGPASGVLDIYIWTMLTLSLGSILGQWMLIENLQILLMYTSIAAALFNVIFNYIFIKLSGLNGAAWATLITPFFSGLLILLFCRKTEKQFRMMLKAIFFIWVFKTAKHLKGN